MKTPRQRILVHAAVIRAGRRFLLARRAPGSHLEGRWEFPGGKPAPGETPQTCLARELREELDLNVDVLRPLGGLDHDYPEKSIRLEFFLCRTDHPEQAKGRDEQEFGWFAWREIANLDLAPADRRFVRRFGALPAAAAAPPELEIEP